MNQLKPPPETTAKSRRYRAGVKADLCAIKASLAAFRRDFDEVFASALDRRSISAQETRHAD